MRNELDRENLQKELDHICSEIDRICKSAKFNTVELFQDVGLEGEHLSRGHRHPGTAGGRRVRRNEGSGERVCGGEQSKASYQDRIL